MPTITTGNPWIRVEEAITGDTFDGIYEEIEEQVVYGYVPIVDETHVYNAAQQSYIMNNGPIYATKPVRIRAVKDSNMYEFQQGVDFSVSGSYITWSGGATPDPNVNQYVSYFYTDPNHSDITNVSEGGRFVTIAKAFAWQLAKLDELRVNQYYQGFIDSAIGVNLDYLLKILGVSRREAKKSAGFVTFTAEDEDQITVPAGTEVATVETPDSPAIYFETTEQVQTSATSPYAATAPIRAVDAGAAGDVGTDQIIVLPDPISGIFSVANAGPIQGGADRESDADYRARGRRALAALGKATPNALEAAIRNVDGVSDARLIDWDQNGRGKGTADLYVIGDVIPMPTSLTHATTGELYATIENTRSAGIDVQWREPTVQDVRPTLYVVGNTGQTVQTITSQVSTKIENEINALLIGGDVKVASLIHEGMDLADTYITNITGVQLNSGANFRDLNIPSTQVARCGYRVNDWETGRTYGFAERHWVTGNDWSGQVYDPPTGHMYYPIGLDVSGAGTLPQIWNAYSITKVIGTNQNGVADFNFTEASGSLYTLVSQEGMYLDQLRWNSGAEFYPQSGTAFDMYYTYSGVQVHVSY